MPKLKTHSGTKDRVKVSKNGKVRAGSPTKPLFAQEKWQPQARPCRPKTRTGTAAKTLRKQLGL